MSKPITRIMVPETKPVGNEAATPRYGSGNVKTYTDIGTENVDAREDNTAEDILRRCSNDMLKPMLTTTNSKGSKGAPSHPLDKVPIFRKQAAPSLR